MTKINATIFNQIEIAALGSGKWQPLYNNVIYKDCAEAAALIVELNKAFGSTHELRIVSVQFTAAQLRKKIIF